MKMGLNLDQKLDADTMGQTTHSSGLAPATFFYHHTYSLVFCFFEPNIIVINSVTWCAYFSSYICYIYSNHCRTDVQCKSRVSIRTVLLSQMMIDMIMFLSWKINTDAPNVLPIKVF